MTDMKEGVFLHSDSPRPARNLEIDIEIQVKRTGGSLHTPNPAISIKHRSPTLSFQPGRTSLKSNDVAGAIEKMSRQHPVERKSWSIDATCLSPLDAITLHIQRKICELGKRESQSAQRLALFEILVMFAEDWESVTEQSIVSSELDKRDVESLMQMNGRI
jgi:hypothetical protein